MKKCSHGDLVPVTKISIRNGASVGDDWIYFRPFTSVTGLNYICNRILLSKLIRTMTEIK